MNQFDIDKISIEALIDNSLKLKRKTKLIKSWHCSGLGSCRTGRFLERKGLEPTNDIDERTLRVFECGNMFEEFVVKNVQETGISAERQVRVELPEWDLTGYADLLITDSNGNKEVVECKSQNSKAFWYMVKQKQGPKLEHKMQLWCYLKHQKINRGRLVYVSKDDLCIAEYLVYLNDKSIEEKVTEEMLIMNEAWRQQLPPPPLLGSCWQNDYCRFHKHCVTQEKYLDISKLNK